MNVESVTSGDELRNNTHTCLSPWWCRRSTADSLRSSISPSPRLRRAGWSQSSWNEETQPGRPPYPELMILMKQGRKDADDKQHLISPPTISDCSGHQREQFRTHFLSLSRKSDALPPQTLLHILLVPWWQALIIAIINGRAAIRSEDRNDHVESLNG